MSTFSIVPSFPAYHGPYTVGTVDVETPVTDLPATCLKPDGAQPTIAFRIFYPADENARSGRSRPVRWIPQPQRQNLAALIEFGGLSEGKANLLSYLPQHLYRIKIPAHRNAIILDPPTSNKRWPVAIFSHGLAGSRNAYSWICGNLASYGMIVVALDHRDGSSTLQHVRTTPTTEALKVRSKNIGHKSNDETFRARDVQLRIRFWEINLMYEALHKIDAGHEVENLDFNTSRNRKERVEVLRRFTAKMDIHRPGTVSWVGHSFGAATVTQLLKSVYYAKDRPDDAGQPLIRLTSDAVIVSQITPKSPTLLLDLWCMPLESPDQSFLWQRPLPSYVAGGPKGDNIVAVLSEAFYNWESNRNKTKEAIAPPARVHGEPQSQSAADSGYASESSSTSLTRNPPDLETVQTSRSMADHDSEESARSKGPHMFYVTKSQHFNQSDFGVLFAWLARRWGKVEDPELILNLNTRAMLQIIRQGGIEIAGGDDAVILSKTVGEIDRWVSVPFNEAANFKNGDGKVR